MEAQTEQPASEPEEDDREDEDDASDGDEYVGEQGQDVSDAEDAAMEDTSTPATSARLQRQKLPKSVASGRSHATSATKDEASSSSNANKHADSKVSESSTRPSASSKTASGSKKREARKPSGPTDASTEEARSRARKVLAAALEKIFSSSDARSAHAKDNNSRATEQDEETGQQRAEAFSALLEDELFESNADSHGSIRVVGSKYKDRFRTFLFSLKDAKNTTLHSRIASGELTASDLAKMSSEELANESIRQATEKARLEALQRSTLRAEEAGPMRKITHKGEIEIESDSLVGRDQPGKFQRSLGARNEATDASPSAHVSPSARISESEPAVPTAQAGGEEETGEAGGLSPTASARYSAPAQGPTQGSPTGLDFGDVWNQGADIRTNDDDQEPHESLGFDVGSPQVQNYDQSAPADIDNAETSGADDFIDTFLDGPGEEANKQPEPAGPVSTSEQPEKSTTPGPEPPGSAVHRYRSIIWNGLIDLPDIFAFQGHVKQVAGRSISRTRRVWFKFFPERPLLIAGRLPSKAAIDYLMQVVNAPRTEILAFTMEPGKCQGGGVILTQESDTVGFQGMLNHFKHADRWGALHVSSSVKGTLIKDFYVVPLFKDEEVPLWLDMAEADCLGADWHTKRDRDLLVLVAVVIRDALQGELTKAERPSGRHRSITDGSDTQQREEDSHAESASAPSHAYDPTAGLSMPLATSSASMSAAGASGAAPPRAPFGSDALQSLLRTLGKTAAVPPASSAPAISSAAGISGALSPLVSAPPPGPPPPGPPPGPPPSFAGEPGASNTPPMAGSWSPPPVPGVAAEHHQWQSRQPPYPTQPYSYSAAAEPAVYNHGGGGWEPNAVWNGTREPPSGPSQSQQLPEEEYPGQYNPDYLAQASSGTTTAAARGGTGFGGRGRGHGHGHGYGQGRGRGGWARGGGRGW